MAEPLVLASVTIDESGVVRSAEVMTQSLAETEQQFRRTAAGTGDLENGLKRVVEHMTNMNGVLRVATHSFGIFALAIEAKRLIESSEAVKSMKEQLSEFASVLTGATSEAEAFAAAFKNLSPEEETAKKLQEVRVEIDKTAERVQSLADPGVLRTATNFYLHLFGADPDTQAAIDVGNAHLAALYQQEQDLIAKGSERESFLKLAGIEDPKKTEDVLDQIARAEAYFGDEMLADAAHAREYAKAIDDLEKKKEKLLDIDTKTKEKPFKFTTPKEDNPLAFAGIPSQGEIDLAIGEANNALADLHAKIQSGIIDDDQAAHALDKLHEKLKLTGPAGEIARMEVDAMRDSFEDWTVEISHTQEVLDSWAEHLQTAIDLTQSVSSAADAAAKAGVISTRDAARVKMVLEAEEDAQKGIREEGEALADFGSGNFVSGALHQLAATLFFAAAAKAGASGISGSGGAASGGSRAGRSSASPVRPTESRVPNLQIIVQGHVIGNEQWLRGAIVQIQRSLGDGTGGGIL